MPYSVSNWKHKRPKSYFSRCIELFGEPTFVVNKKYGYALWKKRGLFTQHILIDEDVKHCVPRPHHDYFYSSVRFFSPKDKVCDVLKISGSLNYDGLKKEITARCGGIGANYATIYLGMLVANGKITIKDVKKDDMYPRMIRGEIETYKQMKKNMMKLKRENNKKYKKEIGYEYAVYAYDKCYTKKKQQIKQKKTRKNRKKIINTRNVSCYSKNMTTCCPHMEPDDKGRYRATNETSKLYYNDKQYILHTCCLMCSNAMNNLSKNNKSKFDKIYKPRVLEDGSLKLANSKTGIYVQKAKLI